MAKLAQYGLPWVLTLAKSKIVCCVLMHQDLVAEGNTNLWQIGVTICSEYLRTLMADRVELNNSKR